VTVAGTAGLVVATGAEVAVVAGADVAVVAGADVAVAAGAEVAVAAGADVAVTALPQAERTMLAVRTTARIRYRRFMEFLLLALIGMNVIVGENQG
jgi:uncharacterized protein (DUF2345 family)